MSLTLTSQDNATTFCIIATKASGRDYLDISAVKDTADFLGYCIGELQALNMADSDFAFCEAVFFELLYNLINHPVITTTFSDLFDSTIFTGST